MLSDTVMAAATELGGWDFTVAANEKLGLEGIAITLDLRDSMISNTRRSGIDDACVIA